jgi:predicted protein tyrosine phosphatase
LSVCLIAAAFASDLASVLALLPVRAALSQMDVPTRTSLCHDASPHHALASLLSAVRIDSRNPSMPNVTAAMDAGAVRAYVAAMQPISLSMLTICGLEELSLHGSRGVTHVLSILDPEHPEPDAFLAYDRHHRTVLRFHDAIEPAANIVLPEPRDVEGILEFGRLLADPLDREPERHLLVHCHAGISRSTAAMAMLMAQLNASEDEDAVFDRLLELRPKAWPNSRMIGFADELMARDGRLLRAVRRLYRRQLAAFPNIATFMRENGRAREVDMAMQAQAV